MNVLSLFDGMSCGMIALDRLGIKVDNYYASEIDKYAMQVSAANYPEIIQVGDITKLDLSTLPKIDLVMGGSPCQGFSFAGKQLAFDDPRSALFFEFVKCVEALKPKYFLLENVKMKKEYLDIISEYMGVEPIFIQSSLVSAQSRQRYYWTNIPNVTPPEERGIVLRDILEDQVGSEHYVGDNMQKNYNGGNQLNPNYKSQANTIHNSNKKSGTICAGTHGYANGYVGDKHKPVKHTERNARHLKQLDDKSLCMTATMYKGAGNNGMTLVPQRVGTIKDGGQGNRIYSKDGKGITLSAQSGGTAGSGNMLIDDTSDLPEKSQTIKSQYYKSSKANFERSGTFHATGIPQKLVSDKPQHIGTAVDIKGHDQIKRVYSPDGKSPTVTTCGGGHREPKVVSGAYRGRYNDDGSTSQKLELTRDSKANAITTVQKDSVVTFSDKRIEKFKETLKENPQPSKNGIIQLNNPSHSSGRVYSPDGKSPTLMAGNSGGGKEPVKINDDMYWRKLTPLECERLQTVPDNYTNHVSNTQRYKMLGNGWTIEVIAHIFKNMEVTQ
jgi:site-specific DNA-cytosine methylase